jgi:multiple sugar transport system substrate-binding protein
MVMQGPWMHNFIAKFASPDFEYTVAPFPAEAGSGLPFLTLVGLDVLVIPRGARHPQAAFTFMTWVNQQQQLEAINRAHFKFSPLKNTSPDFYPSHPNPHIGLFAELAAHPDAQIEARLPSYRAFRNDLQVAPVRTATWDRVEQQVLKHP